MQPDHSIASDPARSARAWAAFRRTANCWTQSGSWVRDDARARASSADDRDREAYVWRPDGGCPDAPLLEYNRTAFCALLRGRPIQVAGDSTSREFMLALHRKARRGGGVVRHEYGAEHSRGYSFRRESAVCEDSPHGPSLAVYLTLRRIYEDPYGIDRWGELSMSAYFGNLSVAHGVRPAIIILNRGTHVSPLADVLRDIRSALGYFRVHHPNALVIWRSTACPHPRCMTFTQPIASPLPTADLDLGSGAGAASYGWREVCAQVPSVRGMLEREWPGVVYMDVSTPMALRPDTHPSESDCVHYKEHSAMDVWVQLLYNLLLRVDHLPARPALDGSFS